MIQLPATGVTAALPTGIALLVPQAEPDNPLLVGGWVLLPPQRGWVVWRSCEGYLAWCRSQSLKDVACLLAYFGTL